MEQFKLHPTLRYLALFAFAIVFRGITRAQTLVGADVLPEPGHSYTTHGITDFIPWDTLQGPGVIWNYEWVTVDTASDQTFSRIEPEDAQGAEDYPSADIAVRSIGGVDGDYIIDRFYDEQPGGIHESGSVGPVLSYVFSDPQLAFAVPAEVGDTASDDYCFTSDGFGIQYNFCGASYVTFDAIGTLVLPYGTFSNVKHLTQWRSSLETTEPATDSSYNVRQLWFLPGTSHPLLEANIYIDTEGEWWPSGRLMAAISVTALAEAATDPVWSIAPNPATDQVHISGLPTDLRRVELLTSSGWVVSSLMQGPQDSTTVISLEGLPAGVYMIRVITDQGVGSRRVVKAG